MADTRLATLKTILNIYDDLQDARLTNYLDLAGEEILSWMYINKPGGVPESVTDVPDRYKRVQIYAVIAGVNSEGGENETSVTENGITRHFHYTDMIEYIHAHVFQIV